MFNVFVKGRLTPHSSLSDGMLSVPFPVVNGYYSSQSNEPSNKRISIPRSLPYKVIQSLYYSSLSTHLKDFNCVKKGIQNCVISLNHILNIPLIWKIRLCVCKYYYVHFYFLMNHLTSIYLPRSLPYKVIQSLYYSSLSTHLKDFNCVKKRIQNCVISLNHILNIPLIWKIRLCVCKYYYVHFYFQRLKISMISIIIVLSIGHWA